MNTVKNIKITNKVYILYKTKLYDKYGFIFNYF